jgi:hypothetical protein
VHKALAPYSNVMRGDGGGGGDRDGGRSRGGNVGAHASGPGDCPRNGTKHKKHKKKKGKARLGGISGDREVDSWEETTDHASKVDALTSKVISRL